MGQNQPPEWWIKQRGSRIGCADVTIVSIACIAAFVLLFLVIARADFVRSVDSLPFLKNATAVSASATPNRVGQSSTRTALAQAGSSAYTDTTPPVAGAATTAAPTAAPATTEPTIVKRATVNANGLNLRRDPSLTADVIATLKQKTVVKLLGQNQVDENNDTWAKIETDEGKQGWVLVRFLEPVV